MISLSSPDCTVAMAYSFSLAKPSKIPRKAAEFAIFYVRENKIPYSTVDSRTREEEVEDKNSVCGTTGTCHISFARLTK